jgi:hypothetical protein
MTTALRELMSRLRTSAPVARLTGLLPALGALIGGAFIWVLPVVGDLLGDQAVS